ncbi:MAG: hypothetical protein ACYC7J_09545 [Syntrophales bacterium]
MAEKDDPAQKNTAGFYVSRRFFSGKPDPIPRHIGVAAFVLK